MKNRGIQPKSVTHLIVLGFFSAILAVAFPAAAQAASGDLDPSFGSGGKVVTPIGSEDDEANALAVQPDGKIVAAGYTLNGLQDMFALVRYNPDGSLDTTFGTNGVVTTAIGTDDDKAFALTVQWDGKLVAGGYSLQDTQQGAQFEFALVRYNPDGSLDTTFGTGGKVTTAIGTLDDEAFALVIQPDGKIVLAGTTDNGSQNEFALVRYYTDGSLDTTFGMGGIVTTAIGTLDDEAFGLAIQPDGNLVAAGFTNNGSQNEFALVRYNTDGSPDATFGMAGIVTTAVGNQDDKATSVIIQPDGKVAAGGYYFNGSQYLFAVARYNPDGTLDEDFGEIAVAAIGTMDDKAYAMVLQTDGKLVLAGYSYNGTENEFALVRFNPDGSRDTDFGTDGKVTTAVGTLSDKVLAMAIQPDEKLMVAGSSYNGQYNFGLTRYLNDSDTSTTTTTTTSTTTSTEATTTTSTAATTSTTTTTTISTTTSTEATTTTTTTTTTTETTTTTTTTTTLTTTSTTMSTTTTTETATTTTTTTLTTTSTTMSTTTTTQTTTTTTITTLTTTSTTMSTTTTTQTMTTTTTTTLTTTSTTMSTTTTTQTTTTTTTTTLTTTSTTMSTTTTTTVTTTTISTTTSTEVTTTSTTTTETTSTSTTTSATTSSTTSTTTTTQPSMTTTTTTRTTTTTLKCKKDKDNCKGKDHNKGK